MKNYFCSDNQFFMPLYYCLCVNYNYDTKAADPSGSKWQGVINVLKRHIHDKSQMDYIIKQIEDGKLTVFMNKMVYPTPQHIIMLISSLRASKISHEKSKSLLERKFRSAESDVINKIRCNAKKQSGNNPVFDQNEYLKRGQDYMNEYINKISGTKNAE